MTASKEMLRNRLGVRTCDLHAIYDFAFFAADCNVSYVEIAVPWWLAAIGSETIFRRTLSAIVRP